MPDQLPAPLFFLENNQIWKLDPNGVARQRITFESRPILSFAVLPNDNALLYMVGDAALPDGIRDLVLLDASGYRVLVSGPIGQIVPHPDGDQIAFQTYAPIEGWLVGSDQPVTGVWSTTRAGGRPNLIQADDPPVGPETAIPPDKEFFTYSPIAWSPDGSQLLMSSYPGYGEAAPPVVRNIADGTTRGLEGACCGDAVWADNQTIVFGGGIFGMDARLGLWRTTVGSNVTEEILPSIIDEQNMLLIAPHPMPQGAVRAFMTLSKELGETGNIGPLNMTEITATGTRSQLRPNDRLNIVQAWWASDGSGAAVLVEGGSSFWLSADNQPPLQLPLASTVLAWGKRNATLLANACDSFRPLAWQPPASRQTDPAVADMQSRLLDLGYSTIEAADGLFGDQTRTAVTVFQQERGLTASGDLDCQTWQVLLGQ
jgi:hypothetical protein